MFPRPQIGIDVTKNLPHPPKNVNTKKFLWSPIKTQTYKDSFWSKYQEKLESSNKPPNIDFTLLQQMFCEAKQEPKPQIEVASQPKTDCIKLLDDKRLMNLSISLSKVKYSKEEIKNILTTYDQGNKFDNDILSTILSIFPNDEETTLFKNFSGDPLKLSSPEQFCLMLVSITNCFTILNFLQFKKNLANEVKDILIKIRIMSECIKSISNSNKFKSLLFLLRQIGNFLNYGTSNGKALGFSVTSLEKLDKIKSFQKDKSTLLDFLVTNIRLNEPDLITFSDEFRRMDEAAQIDRNEMDKQIKQIEIGVDKILKEKEKTKNNDMYLSFLDNMEKYTFVKLECIKISNKMLNDEIDKLITMYGVNKSKFNVTIFIKTILEFNLKFKAVYIKQTRKNNKASKKKEKYDDKKNLTDITSIENEEPKVNNVNKVQIQTFKSKNDFNKIRESVARKTATRKTALMKDLQDIKAFIKNEKMAQEAQQKINSTNLNNNSDINNKGNINISNNYSINLVNNCINECKKQEERNNKVRITNFKMKSIIEEEEDDKLIDDNFFMLHQPIKLSSNVTNNSNNICSTEVNTNSNTNINLNQSKSLKPPDEPQLQSFSLPKHTGLARGRTSKILNKEERKNLLENLK